MSTQYRLVQSGKTVSGGCSAGQGSSEPVAPRIYLFIYDLLCNTRKTGILPLSSAKQKDYSLRYTKRVTYMNNCPEHNSDIISVRSFVDIH
jgi:carbohydrate-binding DOMON domain-containing protein